MNHFLFAALLLIAIPNAAHARCGDNVCGSGEDTSRCAVDCRLPGNPSSESIVADGPAIRGVPYRKGMIVAYVGAENGQMLLRMRIQDEDLKELYSTTILSRPLSGKSELGNPHLIVGPDDTFYLAFRDHDLSGNAGPRYRLRLIRSQDRGRTWEFLDESRNGLIDVASTGLWEPFLYFDAQDRLRVVYAKERDFKSCPKQRGEKQDIVTRVSLDQGKTWVQESVVASDGVSRDGVPSVARLQDGSYMMVFESWQSAACGHANPDLLIRSMTSRDGVDWSNRAVVFDPYAMTGKRRGVRASWPFITALKDGRAVVTFTSNFKNLRFTDFSETRPERDKTYDVFTLSTTGMPSIGNIRWDQNSLTSAFPFKDGATASNRYASAVALKNGRLVVLSGLPARYVVFDY